jgi:hypothetical protein
MVNDGRARPARIYVAPKALGDPANIPIALECLMPKKRIALKAILMTKRTPFSTLEVACAAYAIMSENGVATTKRK